MTKEINSRQNAKFKTWASLLESKGVKKERLCLVSGPKILEELLRQKRVKEIILPPKGGDRFLRLAHDLPSFRLHGDLFNMLDVVGTGQPLGVVEVPEIKAWVPVSGLTLVLALSDPNNLGACLRTAEAMAVDQVVLTKECASPFLPKALRAASGSTFRTRLASAPSIHELSLDDVSGTNVGLDLQGEDIHSFLWNRDTVLIIGEEGQGLPDQMKVKRVKIPIQSSVESLNAVVATSIALFSYRIRFPLI